MFSLSLSNATHLTIPSNYSLGASVELAYNLSLTITNTSVPVITSAATSYTAEVFNDVPPIRTLPATLKSISSVRYYTINSSDNSNLYTDMTPLQVNYYRIKQVDLDGKYAYSTVIAVQNKVDRKQFAVQPNPVSGSRLNCFIPDEQILAAKEVMIRIYDISGKVISTIKTAPVMYLPVDCSGFKPGMYVITIEGGGNRQQSKFILQ